MGDFSRTGFNKGVIYKREFIKEFEKIMTEQKLDGFISPASSVPAFRHYESKELSMGVIINVVSNLLDYTACVIPCTKVTKEDLQDEYNDRKYPNDHFVKQTREMLKDSLGMPIGIQICTRTYQEEKCLAISKLVDEALKSRK